MTLNHIVKVLRTVSWIFLKQNKKLYDRLEFRIFNEREINSADMNFYSFSSPATDVNFLSKIRRTIKDSSK